MIDRTNINDVLRAMMKGQPGVRHDKEQAKRVNAFYHHRSAAKTGQWRDVWECPVCHRTTQQLSNFLGDRAMWCDGIRWYKEKN